jgi:hypothetical protein
MLSFIFLVFALIHLSLWLWGWQAWSRAGRPVALFLVLFASTLLWWDNFRIGAGRFIGEGELLKAMTWPAFAWHWSLLPLLIIAAGSIARLAGFGWAQKRWVMGGFCLVAVALSILDIPKIFSLELHAACVADTLRYSNGVSAAQLCSPDAQVVQGDGAALVAILCNLVVLGVGIAIWVRHRWPWMALGAGAMFICAGAFGGSYYALPISNFGEILITGGLIATALHFARHPVQRAVPVPA